MASSSYVILAYDAIWAGAYEGERKLVVAALGKEALGVEHIGSTAVPGLGAKPVVDLMVGVMDKGRYERCVALLESLGYAQRGETVPGTLYNRKAVPRRFNLHLTEMGGSFWVEHLLFRDWLRAHAETAAEYEGLKRRLMEQLADDPPAYNARKGPFIRGIIERARAVAS